MIQEKDYQTKDIKVEDKREKTLITFFFPSYGEIKAESLEEATAIYKKKLKES